jgi:ubiquinone/menaquinone biosynthesis C-methylase UbiE
VFIRLFAWLVFTMPLDKNDPAFMNQFKCPTGLHGRAVAELMNQEHCGMTTWGLKHVKIKPDFVILDVGCGGGRTVGRLARRAFQGKIFGVDCSTDMVKYGRELNRKLVDQGRLEIVEGLVEKLSFPDGFFDLVTAFETYYFWHSLSTAFREIKRVLKPAGTLLLVNEMVKDGVYEVENDEMITKAHVRLLSLPEIKSIVCAVGFVDVKVFIKANTPWNAVAARKP